MKIFRRRSRYRIKKRFFRQRLLVPRFFRQKRRLIIFGAAAAVMVVVIASLASAGQLPAVNAAAAPAAQNMNIAEQAAPSAVASAEPTPVPTPTPDPTLKPGDQNERVQQLQERLMQLGYLALDQSTQLYGPATKYAVELFQRQHAMEQDGIADPQTLNLIHSDQAQQYMLLEGTSGNDVDSLQRQLIDLGYMDTATGYYGTETNSAVKAFQERNGLAVDGKTGPQTLDLIYSPNAEISETKVRQAISRANILEMIDVAQSQLGDPYVWGAQGPNSFDCSGLVYYCLREAGSSRGRYDAAGYSKVSDWEKIDSMNDLEIGDLLFFSTNGKRVGHTGIYIGGGVMIDASSANGKVVQRECKTGFWERNFVVARRPW